MKIDVRSETGRLRRVLVHEPGPEVDRFVPSMMEELLFDDILYGARAREEHARFRRVLRLLGVEPVEARTLLEQALEESTARDWLCELIADDLPGALRERLDSASAAQLAAMLIEGRRVDAPQGAEVEQLFELPPLPNWCFQRDPQVVLGDRVIFGSMATPARYREALLTRAIFAFHPDLRDARVWFDPLHADPGRTLFLGLHKPRIEGGDVLVLSEQVIAVGESERTNQVGIQRLARALARAEGGPRWLLAVELPRRRAYMHLDTLFTAIDEGTCLVHAPVILPGGAESAPVYEFDLHAKHPEPRPAGDLLAALRLRGLDFEPVVCGGTDPVSQLREQWTDGANCLALAPGVITLYERNLRTVEELGRRGFRAVQAEDLLLGRTELSLDAGERACLVLPSNEISRARGGPRCLTHPLLRD